MQTAHDKGQVSSASHWAEGHELEDKHAVGGIVGFCLNLSEYPVRLRSGDYGNILPEARQASLNKTDSEVSAPLLVTVVKSEDVNNYLSQVINQLYC